MNTLFPKTNAYWVRYSEYEYRLGEDKNLYIMPVPQAEPSVYDPLKDAETLVIDALNLGRLAMKRGDETKIQQAVLEFISKYGLLGFMTALPTTPEFMDYEAVYLPKNHFLKAETMSTEDYLSLFFPFRKPDLYKDKTKTQWNISTDSRDRRKVMAVAMTFNDSPTAVGLGLMPFYAERYDWFVTQFRDWAFLLVSTFLFYDDKDEMDDFTRDLCREGVSAFGGKAPTYRIRLYDDKPSIVWDFRSLLLTIQTMFGFALTDEKRPLRLCKHCNLAFFSGHPNAEFCGARCKNQYNVYKGRGNE
jgi:hypothetical protein